MHANVFSTGRPLIIRYVADSMYVARFIMTQGFMCALYLKEGARQGI